MKYRYIHKNKHLFGLDIGKINICGVILVTRCHLKIRVFFSFWKRWFYGEFGHFTTCENGVFFPCSHPILSKILPILNQGIFLDEKAGNLV
jgi:hypothetical protein